MSHILVRGSSTSTGQMLTGAPNDTVRVLSVQLG
jgi:hypothetical protein